MKRIISVAFLLFVWVFYFATGTVRPEDDIDSLYIDHIGITQLDRGTSGQSTLIKVVLNPPSNSYGDPVAIVLWAPDGKTYQFGPEEFHSADTEDFYLKERPFFYYLKVQSSLLFPTSKAMSTDSLFNILDIAPHIRQTPQNTTVFGPELPIKGRREEKMENDPSKADRCYALLRRETGKPYEGNPLKMFRTVLKAKEE